eukprot:GHVR01016076.1.p1 GENE.GHVR01016076.1~~GHVR01016076.1.p1  ORF type:complete len:415 (-),score=40.31 GHVR01016076.1:131-1375(-)
MYSHSKQWHYYQRITPNCAQAFTPLEHTLHNKLIPNMLDGTATTTERRLFALPTRLGGLDITDPTTTAHQAHHTSLKSLEHIIQAVKGTIEYSTEAHINTIREARKESQNALKSKQEAEYKALTEALNPHTVRCMERSRKYHTSSWLNVQPIEKNNYNLSPTEFRDAINLRYGRPLTQLPRDCDGCGAPLSKEHALDCRKGGLVSKRHNEVRDAIANIASIAYMNVEKEVVILEATQTHTALVADIKARGVWQSQVDALFDISVVDTDAPSHYARPTEDVLTTKAQEKKKKYVPACEARRASFTPLIFSVDGAADKETTHFLQHTAGMLAAKWSCEYHLVMKWIRIRVSLAVLRATSCCLRGSRKKWRTVGATLETTLENSAPPELIEVKASYTFNTSTHNTQRTHTAQPTYFA